jgi:hypothetical protein
MKFSRTLAAVAAFALTASSLGVARTAETPSDAKHLLRYKFALGEVLRYRVAHATNLRSTVDGTTQQVKTDSDSVKVWKVTDVLPTGEIEFIHLVESVKMTNAMPGQPPRTFDSTSSDPPAPGFEAAARNVGVPLVVVRITPQGKVTSREEKVPQAVKPSEDMPMTLELPDEPVAVGDRWSHVYDIMVKKASGVDVQIRTRRACRLKQVRSGVAIIEVEYQILTPVDPYIRSQIVERLTKGVVRFDIDRGRIVQQQHDVDRREVGFAGKQAASSMAYVARVQERLLPPTPQVTSNVQPASATK